MRCNHFVFLLLMAIPSLNGCFARKYVMELGERHTTALEAKDEKIKELETQLSEAKKTIAAYSKIVTEFEAELSAKYKTTTTRSKALQIFAQCQKEQMEKGRSCMLMAEMKPARGCDTKDPMPNTYKQKKLSEEEAALKKESKGNLTDSNFAVSARDMPNCLEIFEYTTEVKIQDPP